MATPKFDLQTHWPNKVDFSAPGKLFLMGEYAILQPGCHALIMAVDRYIQCTIAETDSTQPSTSRCQSDWPGIDALQIELQTDGTLSFDSKTLSSWNLVIEAIRLVKQLCQSQEKVWRPFQMQIQSQLQSQSGQKFGLGSSGAVTVSVLGALLTFQGLKEWQSPMTLFKLACLASYRTGSNGSMADIAASSYGGLVYYRRFQSSWLAEQIKSGCSLPQLLSQDWPDLLIEVIPVPADLQIQIGWTGQPASSQNLVAQLKEKLVIKARPYQDFCQQVDQMVQAARQALENESLNQFLNLIAKNQQALQALALSYDLAIVSDQLANFIHVSQKAGWIPKISGAGGGDCGLAFSDQSHSTKGVLQAWQTQHIQALDFQIAPARIPKGGSHEFTRPTNRPTTEE